MYGNQTTVTPEQQAAMETYERYRFHVGEAARLISPETMLDKPADAVAVAQVHALLAIAKALDFVDDRMKDFYYLVQALHQ